MNRQVIPSMILSVLIVGIFSVVLYVPDKPKAQARTACGGAPGASPSGSAVPKVEKTATRGNGDSRDPDPGAGSTEKPGKLVKDSGAVDKPQAPVDDLANSVAEAAKAAGAPAVKPQAVTETVPNQAVARPTSQPDEPRAVSTAPPVSSFASLITHRSGFTTVKDGEALEDVAARVYGSADKIDLLWKANRDVLPERNSQLLPGTVLRTPGS